MGAAIGRSDSEPDPAYIASFANESVGGEPWSRVASGIPTAFRLGRAGLFHVREKGEEEQVSGPVWVEARTRDPKGDGWGVVVAWMDGDGRPRKQAFPAAQLHERGSALPAVLASMGLQIVPGKERLLLAYIGRFECPSRLRSVSRLGWLDAEDSTLNFVTPHEVIRRTRGESVIYQPERHSPIAQSMCSAGTLAEWKDNVEGLATVSDGAS